MTATRLQFPKPGLNGAAPCPRAFGSASRAQLGLVALLARRVALWIFALSSAISIVSGAHAADAGATENYRLGPGDRIRVSVFGEPDLSLDVVLGEAGTLAYPFLGELKVEGLTVGELQQRVASGLKGPYLVDPVVTISISEYRPFFVHGEVQKPGGIAYQPRLTIERAIALAGGFTEFGTAGRITIIRGGSQSAAAAPVLLSDPVLPGDIITVGQRSFF